jgi:hypothetical protein
VVEVRLGELERRGQSLTYFKRAQSKGDNCY